jgi:hypothetical protein
VASDVIFELNRPEFERMKGWTGPVGLDFERRIRTLVFRAKTSAGVKTGGLKADIRVMKRGTHKYGLSAQVGSSVDHAMAHHEGARPHVIRARRPGGKLRFEVRGQIIFRTSVNHPGNRANPYLSRWLSEFVR